VIAHVAGLPVEEALLPLAGWTCAALVAARGWLASRAGCRTARRCLESAARSGQRLE